LVGKLVVGLIGLAWTLASFLVVPILAFEEAGPFEALRRSAELFRKTWGEQVAGGFSFGLIFFLLALPGVLLPLIGQALTGPPGLIVGVVLLVLYIVLLSVVSSATRGIFVAAL
jgi:tetrahydromethanopterin S-methyltransferase subunit E